MGWSANRLLRLLGSELFAGGETRAVSEFAGGNFIAAFELDGFEAEGGFFSARDI